MRFVSLMAENMDSVYSCLMAWIGRNIGFAIDVECSVPWQERERMLDRGEVQIGSICGLPYVRKADRLRPVVELLAAPVMQQGRYKDRPVYFSDIVVRGDSPFQTFADLRGCTWAYNEPNSQSGYNLTRFFLASLGERTGYFDRVVESGAHQLSVQMIVDGEVDASAIDSTVLEMEKKLRPQVADRLRVIHTLGPSPAPPFVASTRVNPVVRRDLQRLLLSMHTKKSGRELLRAAGIARFSLVRDSDYDSIRHMARIARGVRLARHTRMRHNAPVLSTENLIVS